MSPLNLFDLLCQAANSKHQEGENGMIFYNVGRQEKKTTELTYGELLNHAELGADQ